MISVTILTKNSALHLEEVLSALGKFQEVVVYDTGSDDSTLAIAKKFPNVVSVCGTFTGFGPTHNVASSHASNDWVFSIDSDEVVTQALFDEIASLHLDPLCVYSIARDNFYRKKHITGCGWYPDRVVRLYHRKKTRFSDDLVHEKVISDGMHAVSLTQPLRHYPYQNIDDFLRKMQSYTSLFAKQYKGKKRVFLSTAVWHAIAAFLKSYLLKRGIALGSEGLEISLYNAITAYYKYLKLRDVQEEDVSQ